MRVAVCPGSFDPITKGHIDIITRATKLFDKVIIAVSVNPSKHGSFDLNERVNLISLCVKHLNNVEIDVVNDLLADYAKRVGACAETIFLTTAAENMYLSSSLVKQIASFGGDISDFVPSEINEIVAKRLYQTQNNLGGQLNDN